MLKIEDLHVEVDGKPILKGINLEVKAGEVHAIMGPNGSGKSTLAYVLAGRDGYEVTKRQGALQGPRPARDGARDSRCRGLFLGFQYPVAIPGVSNIYFLKAALNAIRKHRGEDPLDAIDFMKLSKEKAALVQLPDELTKRSVNDGFSGGEKKRNEIFQMAVLEPSLAVLDETDSGLDIDALQGRGRGCERAARSRARDAGHHPLSAPARLHRAGCRARADRRTNRSYRRQGPREAAREGRVQPRFGTLAARDRH